MVDTEKLILLIEKEESVWNINSKDFLHKILKTEAWNRIANNLTLGWNELSPEDKEQTIESLKKKWNHIKDYYKREKKAKKIYYSKRKSEYTERRKYIFYNILRFLDPTLGIRQRHSWPKPRNLHRSATYISSNTIAKEEISESSQESHATLGTVMTQTTQAKQNSTDYLSTQTPQGWKDMLTEYAIPDNTARSLNSAQNLDTQTPHTRQDMLPEHSTMETTPHKQHIPGFLETSPNVAFLLSCAQEMDEMMPYERMEFKHGVINLLKKIKYPVKMEMN